jgi:hypothetical protein
VLVLLCEGCWWHVLRNMLLMCWLMELIAENHMVAVSTHSKAQIRLKLAMTCDITPASCFHKLCSKFTGTISIFNSFCAVWLCLEVFILQFSVILYKLNQDCGVLLLSVRKKKFPHLPTVGEKEDKICKFDSCLTVHHQCRWII